jgi:hypothetical protein
MSNDNYDSTALTRELEYIGNQLKQLEALADKVDSLYDVFGEIGNQLERIADVMELDSDQHQALLREKAAERARWARQNASEAQPARTAPACQCPDHNHMREHP